VRARQGRSPRTVPRVRTRALCGTRSLELESVKTAARGRWQNELFPALGIRLTDKSLRYEHDACPGCGGTDRFRLSPQFLADGFFHCTRGDDDEPLRGDGLQLIRHVYGCSLPEAIELVAQCLGMSEAVSPFTSQPPQRCAPQRSAFAQFQPAKEARLQMLLSACGPISAESEVGRYLESRGLGAIFDDLPRELIEHPSLRYYEDRKVMGTYAAMIGVFRNFEEDLVNLERKYVLDGHKAPVQAHRKLCTPCRPSRGASVHLYEANERLALAEGIESALAVRLISGWPVWACGSCHNLATVSLPESVREVAIWADHNHAGMKSVEKLSTRLQMEGIAVTTHVPPLEGMDPLDWYLAQRTNSVARSASDVECRRTKDALDASDTRAGRARGASNSRVCGACDHSFNSTTAFDEHRIGKFTRDPPTHGRRCLSTDEMLARGMTQGKRGWLTRAASRNCAVRNDAAQPSS
jgi:putative DNA primase/helicase